MKQFGKIYSYKFIKALAFIEIIFYVYLIFKRVEIIIRISRLDKGLRQLIDLIDHENGWNLIFLLLLLTSNILTFYAKRIAWIIKQTGLICITISLLSKMPFPGLLTILLIIYYSTNKATIQFDIMMKERRKLYLRVFLLVFILITISQFDFLKY